MQVHGFASCGCDVATILQDDISFRIVSILLDSHIHAFLLNRRVLLVSLVSIQVVPA